MLLKNHSKKEKKPSLDEKSLLLSEIERTKSILESSQVNFSEACDPALVDSYIYEIKAAQLKYQFLLRRVKQLNT
ncbi:YaaL family protein [Lachnotalea sp. AF33-28]|jgi:hypothetical protein|uniref:YaaL family protein n=1 Tax=Lachnotalea sp. AF33-28 TaxID=2292046 RepID=UPI000E4B1128|nr:YaaL family protein [Lachnotalea sp. AF33-28]RHP30696.1 DUF2508 family protein [Lachnotalea sp. AF33-28]